MSKFHSIVSRRDFMKGLGLAGAGMGAASLVVPTFHDLDELIASEEAGWKRPWWIKHLEHEHPTVDIDWKAMKRHDGRLTTQASYVNAEYAGKEAWAKNKADAAAFAKTLPGTKGNTLRDIAVNAGCNSSIHTSAGMVEHWSGPKICKTPQDLGMPKWSGSPEETSRVVRAAASFIGARVAFSELGPAGSDPRKLVYSYSREDANSDKYIAPNWPPPLDVAARVDEEEIDIGYHDGKVIHLPKKPLWKISVMIPMAREAWRTAQPDRTSQLANAANSSRYRLYATVKPCLQEFLRALGFMGYGNRSSGEQLVPSLSSAILGGSAEMARHSDAAIDPEYGANMGYWTIVTDIPLAPDNPIDAGIWRFCHTCRKCADACPSESVSFDSEPSWEVPSFNYKVPNMNQNPGKKIFWTDMHSCVLYRNIHGCNVCRPSCTFNVNSGAIAHQVIRSTVSITPLFNGFFYRMAEPFGYGAGREPEEWWDMALPMYGYDSTTISTNGGYRK